MTTLVKTLIDKLQEKPEKEQDEYAAMFLGELEAEEKWDTLFSDPRSPELLSRMADKARKEHETGKTEPLEDLFTSDE
jgi:hypothetical protein